MSISSFQILYDKVVNREAGWEEALLAAWQGGCLTEDQKSLLEAVV